MNKILYVLALVSSAAWAHPYTIDGDPHENVESVLPKEKVEPLINDSYALLSTAYTDFAKLFNVCQKTPNNPVCDDRYKVVASCFKKVESNNTVLKALTSDDMKPIHLPEFQLIELQKNLIKLGYMPETIDVHELDRTGLQLGLDNWAHANDLPDADSIYLMHLMLVRSQVLAMDMKQARNNYQE